MIPILMLIALCVAIPLWARSIQHQVKKHHDHREKKRLSSRDLIAVHKPKHTPAGGHPVHH